MLSRLLTFAILLAAGSWLVSGLWSRFGSLRGVVDELTRKTRSSAGVGYARGLAYLVAVVSVALLALTGFVPFVLAGGPLDGFALVVHVLSAPLFSVSVTVLILLWAHDQRFDAADLDWSPSTARKVCFWSMVVLAPLILGSIVLMMYPVFGTPGQEALRTLHFTSALAFLLTGMTHARLAAAPVEEQDAAGKGS